MQKSPASGPASWRRIGGLALLAALVATVALPAQAQWKWKDASGKIQYSDLPPPSVVPDKDILQRPPGQELRVVQLLNGRPISVAASAPAPVASQPSKAELDDQAKQKAKAQQDLAKQKAEDARLAEERRVNCVQARNNARMLASGQRVSRPNDQGENIVMDDNQRAAELQRVQGIIDSQCSQ